VLLTTIATNTLKTSKLATTLHKEAHAATRG